MLLNGESLSPVFCGVSVPLPACKSDAVDRVALIAAVLAFLADLVKGFGESIVSST